MEANEGRSVGRLARTPAVVVALLVVGAGAGIATSLLSRQPSEPGEAGRAPERIAFVMTGSKVGLGVDNTDVFTVLPDGSALLNLTDDEAAVARSVAWSWDGRKVAYVRQDVITDGGRLSPTAGIFVMNADGSDHREVLPCNQAAACSYHHLAWSPDGLELAFIEDYQQPFNDGFTPLSQLVVLRLADRRVQAMRCPEGLRCRQGVSDPTWSPDGSKILFSMSRSDRPFGSGMSPIFVVNADGTGLRQLTNYRCLPGLDGAREDCTFDVGPVWSPDGHRIAFLRSGGLQHGLMVMNADGSGVTSLASCHEVGCWVGRPVWSPDGSSIAYGSDGPALNVVNLGGSRANFALPGCPDPDCGGPYLVVWSPDGSRLAFLSGSLESDLYVIRADGAGLSRLAEGVECCLAWLPGTHVRGTPEVTPISSPPRTEDKAPPITGLIAFSSDLGDLDESEAGEIVTIRSDRSGLSRLTRNREWDGYPAWSPDGKRIAFGSLAGATNHNVFVMDADGSDRTRLTNFRYAAGGPTWSLDGTRIAFFSEGPETHLPDAVTDIFVMDADGTGVRRITVGTTGDHDPAWSPDGQWILFVRDDGLHLVHPDGTGLHRLIELPGATREPAWSPDGTQIAFSWFTSSGRDVYVMEADGSDIRRVTNLPGETVGPTWSPDGSYLAFNHGYLGRFDLYVIGLDHRGPWLIAPASSQTSGPSWQPVQED